MDAQRLEAAINAGRIADILDALGQARTPGRRRWLREGLRRAVDQADPGSIGQRERRRLAELGWSQGELEALGAAPPPSAVHVPLVPVTRTTRADGADAPAGWESEASSSTDAFCRLMIVSYDPSGTRELREQYDADARAAVIDGLHAAADAVGRVALDGHSFLPFRAGTLAKLRIAGASLGAAAAVSAASVWSRRRVRPKTAVTGRIAADRIAAVGGIRGKVAALRGRADIERLVVPAEDRQLASAIADELGLDVQILGAATVGELLEMCLEPEPRPEVDPEHAVAEARQAYDRGWQGWQWPALIERFERLATEVPQRRPDLQVRVWTMLAAAHRNLGDPEQSLEVFEEARALLQTEEADIAVPDAARTFFSRNLAITLRQLCRFDEALEAAREAERCARQGRLRGDLAFALGTRGLVHLSLEEAEQAIACQRQALQHLLRHAPRYAPRTVSYLVEALGHAGQIDEAWVAYRKGMELAQGIDDPNRRRTVEQWLRTHMAGALRDPARASEARALLQHPRVQDAIERTPLPGLLATRWLGLAEVAIGERRTGYARLATSPAQYPQAREPHVRFLAHLNVLFEGYARAQHGEVDRDAIARMRHAVAHLPQTEAVAAFLSAPAAEVLTVLAATQQTSRAAGRAASNGGEALLGPLERLLRACAKLG